ncbi:MAG: hypothetical protein MJ016_05815 [Victivallaceae bacterium]|nr:hypothetical protein [Victivallaceae bacterium]
MIQLLSFASVQSVLGILYGIFGMTLLPDFLRRTENKNALFLVSPLLGGCVWLALSVGLGLLFPYNVWYLAGALLLAAIWVFYRRKTLFLPGRPAVWILLAWIIFFSAMIGCDIAPRKIDGGLYFAPCVYDHVKCAIVHSIASHGLPPVNPWLADGGKPLALIYYFGWHAWTAQLPVLTGCDAFFAECAMTGFTFALVMAGIAGLTGF